MKLLKKKLGNLNYNLMHQKKSHPKLNLESYIQKYQKYSYQKELQRYENLVEEHSKTGNNNDTTKLVIEKAAIVQKLRAKHKQLV